jgi:hypothetical protein
MYFHTLIYLKSLYTVKHSLYILLFTVTIFFYTLKHPRLPLFFLAKKGGAGGIERVGSSLGINFWVKSTVGDV